MNRVSESADGSTRVRAIVWRGSRFGNESRACNAASFAERRAASGGGDAYVGVDRVGRTWASLSSSNPSSASSSIKSLSLAEEDCFRML